MDKNAVAVLVVDVAVAVGLLMGGCERAHLRMVFRQISKDRARDRVRFWISIASKVSRRLQHSRFWRISLEISAKVTTKKRGSNASSSVRSGFRWSPKVSGQSQG